MKIQYLNGGLANQAFQYIFVRYAELSNPQEEPWFFDDSFFYVNQVHNGLELEKVFGLKLNLLSQSFDSEVWEEFLENKKQGISVPQSFKNLGFDIMMITEFENYQSHNPFDGRIYQVSGNHFVPEIVHASEPFVYYHGYWLNPEWFESFRDIIRKELTFPPITDTQNLDYANRILSSESVSIHIRRGDFVDIGWASDTNYYLKKVQQVLISNPNAIFFVFSDDIPWCRRNADALGLTLPSETVYIEGNTYGRNYIDMQLMSLCPIMILNRSSFGYLAMLLNNRLDYFLYDES